MSDKPYDRPPANLEELTPEVRIAWPRGRLWLLAIAILLVLISVWFAGLLTRTDSANKVPEVARIELTDRDPMDATNRATWQPLVVSLTESMRAIADARKQWAEHERELNELLDSDAGRRIAATPARVERYVSLVERSQPAASSSDPSATAAELFQAANQALAADVLPAPAPASFVERSDELKRKTTAELESINTLRSELAKLLREAAHAATDGPRLREALTARQAQNSTQQTALQLAEQARKQRTIEEQAMHAQREQAAQAEAARREAARHAEAAEKHRLRLAQFRQELPAMRPYLTPFITPGRMQLGKYGWETSAESAPLSWTALSKVLGAPGDSRATTMLVNTFGELDTKNDRPYGSFPRRYQPDLDRGTLVRLIEFLQANGDLLVEEGLLRP